jgi:hypothetical protein
MTFSTEQLAAMLEPLRQACEGQGKVFEARSAERIIARAVDEFRRAEAARLGGRPATREWKRVYARLVSELTAASATLGEVLETSGMDEPLFRRLTAADSDEASSWTAESDRLSNLRADLLRLADDLEASEPHGRGPVTGSSRQHRLVAYLASAYLGITGQRAVAERLNMDSITAAPKHFVDFVGAVADALGLSEPADITVQRALSAGRGRDEEFDEPLIDDERSSAEAFGHLIPPDDAD